MNRSERAVELFYEGCNCSQAVLCAFEDITGLSHDMSLKISCGFGGGVSRLRELCGAVSGMIMAFDILYGYTDVSEPSYKSEHYKAVQELCKRFREKAGSIVCRELLGIKGSSEPYSPPRTEEFYRTRPCARLIKLAAETLDDYIRERENDGLPEI